MATGKKRAVSRGSIRYPAPSLTLDWRPFEDGREAYRFERMASELFFKEHDAKKFIPNAKRMGPDGGADGIYNGTIDGIPGPWKLAIAVRDRDQFAALKKKTRDENELARRDGYRGLFFITSFPANAVQTNALIEIAAQGLDGAQVWAQETLDRLLGRHVALRQTYFGHQLVPGFVPGDSTADLDTPAQPDIDLVGRSRERDALQAFATGPARIAIIVAAGGSGKTRLLRELPKILREIKPPRSVWSRRPGQGTIDAAAQSGLPLAEPLAITLDDAMQARPELIELARLARDPDGIDVKLVAAIRTVDLPAAKVALVPFADAIEWIALDELVVEDRALVAKLECRSLLEPEAMRLARAFGRNLFLLRAAAQQIKRGAQPRSVVDDEQIRASSPSGSLKRRTDI